MNGLTFDAARRKKVEIGDIKGNAEIEGSLLPLQVWELFRSPKNEAWYAGGKKDARRRGGKSNQKATSHAQRS